MNDSKVLLHLWFHFQFFFFFEFDEPTTSHHDDVMGTTCSNLGSNLHLFIHNAKPFPFNHHFTWYILLLQKYFIGCHTLKLYYIIR
jgi:hypothetical protein